MTDLRFRQVHLDFHTSGQIPGIGSRFNPDEFAETLKAAHVNSVTCFARGHHGWIYYDTRKFPERRHPHLTCTLLEEQIEACHARDIRVPIYTTVQWDLFTVRRHPEWLVQDEEGGIPGTKPFEPGFYRYLCLNSPYVDFLEEHTVELCETVPVDGIFFDIVQWRPCCCRYCIEGMQEAGLDPADAERRAQFAAQVLLRFKERMSDVVRSRHPEATVFFNAGHVGPRHRPLVHTYTHLELESLPSGGIWGYMHFPIAQHYARNLGVDTMGMTGKFHTVWGDFQSLKNPAALEFECLNMLALGAKCSIGDQLHPTGTIDTETYSLIGDVYAKVEAAEPWCKGAKPATDIGLLTAEEFAAFEHGTGLPPATIGAARILQESHHQFDILDSQSDFTRYRALILPDVIPIDDVLAAKLSQYVAAGGALLASCRSGLHPEGDHFNLPELGVACKGDAPYSPDFIVPGQLGEDLRETAYVMYLKGLEVEPVPGAEVLCSMIKPYFNRTWEHFCSHQHTPPEGPAEYPGVVRNGNCIYFMHPIFTQYDQNAPFWCKKLVANALDLLLPEPLLRAEAPSAAVFTVNEQPDQDRVVVHALHYVPERRGRDFDIIEDIIPIHEIPVSVRAEGAVRSVALQPQGEALDFEEKDGRVHFIISRIEGHQMVVLEKVT